MVKKDVQERNNGEKTLVDNISKDIRRDFQNYRAYVSRIKYKKEQLEAVKVKLTGLQSIKITDMPKTASPKNDKNLYLIQEKMEIEDSLKKLIKKSKDYENAEGLILATKSQNEELVSVFLNSNVDVNARNLEKSTALLAASADSSVLMVKLLLKQGAEVNIKNINGESPLSVAKTSDIAQLILKKFSGETGENPLFSACLYDDLENIKLFITKYNFSPNEKDEYGNTPLYNAINKEFKGDKEKYIDVINYLIENGANVNSKDIMGRTPLMRAAQYGFPEALSLLLKNGAEINHKAQDESTALHYAVSSKNLEAIKILIANKADINAKDELGFTPLYYAIQEGNKEIAEELLKNKASLSINGDNGDTLAKKAEELAENIQWRRNELKKYGYEDDTPPDQNYDELVPLLKKYGYKPAPIELWNGFTESMNKEQVISRARKILNSEPKDLSREIDKDFAARTGGAPEVFYGNYSLNDFAVPDSLTCFFSKNSEFATDGSRSVEFYFYENNLYAVNINWNLDIKDIIFEKAIENYGRNYQKKTDWVTFGSGTNRYTEYNSEILCWELKNRKTYLSETKGTNDCVKFSSQFRF